MNKLLQKVAKLFLGISMAAGVGVAVSAGRKDASPVHGADSEAYASVNSNGGTSSWTLLNGSDSIIDVSASAVTSYSSQLRMAANSTLTFTPHSGQSIVMKTIRFKTNSVTSYMPGSGSSYTVDSGSATSFTANGSTNATLTLSKAASTSVVIKFGNAVRLTELGVTYGAGGGGSGGGDVITEYTDIAAGDYNIVFHLANNDTDYYMTTTLDGSSRFTTSTSSDDAGVFSFESAGTNQWYVSCDLSGTKTYFKPGTSNGVTVKNTSSSDMAMTAQAGTNGNIRLGVGSNYLQRNGTANTNIVGRYTGTQRDIFKLVSVASGFTVQFNVQGHGTAPANQTIADGGKVTQPTAPTATGYTFGGWYKEAACTNAWNFSTDTVTANTTLWAKWTTKSSALTFNLNEGSGTAPTGKTATYGSAMPAYGESAPTRTGYTFGGFYDGSGGTGTQYYTAALTSARNWDKDVTSGTTLYAKWIAKTSALTFNLNTGSGTAPTGKTATYGSAMPAYGQSAPTKTGYTFAGFYDGEGGTGTQYYTAGLASARTWDKDTTDGTTLYAKWTINSYTVTGTISNGELSNDDNVNYNEALSITIVPDTANDYTYPASIESVTMGGDPYNGYTYDSSDGSFYIEHVTGNVAIVAHCVDTSAVPHSVDYDLTNCTISHAPETIYDNEIVELQIVVNEHYKLPLESQNKVSVTGIDVSKWSYDEDDGTIIISEPDHDMTVTVECVAKAQNTISMSTLTGVSQQSGNPTSVEEGAIVTLTFVANSGYGLPDSSGVTVSGAASSSWTQGSGTLQITGGTSNITISIIGIQRDLTDGNLTLGTKQTTYTLGDDFIKPSTVTANFNLAPLTVDVKNDVVVSGPVENGVVTGSGTVTLTYTFSTTGKTQSAQYAITANSITPSSDRYVKITSALTDWSGTYLIVDETSSNVMDGTLTSNNGAYKSVTITNNEIAATSTINTYAFTIAKGTTDNTKYTVQSHSGYYIDRPTAGSGGGLTVSNSNAYELSIVYSTNHSEIRASCYASSGSNKQQKLQWNNSSSIFKFYNSTQRDIQLYKFTEGTSKELKWITAEVKSGTYYQGSAVTASDFTVTAHYNDGTTSTPTTDITVTNGTLSVIGSNNVTLTYGGKSCVVPVTAVEQTATLTGLTWAQGELTIIDGHAIDFSTLGTVTATYDTSPSSHVALDICTVSTYTKSNDTYTKVSDIDDGDTISSTSHGKYLGVSYTEKGVTKVAYSSAAIYVVEEIEDVFIQEPTTTWSKVTSLAEGDIVTFVNESASKVASSHSSNIIHASAYEDTVSSEFYFEVGKVGNYYTFRNENGYLGNHSTGTSSNNYAYLDSEIDEDNNYNYFTVSFSEGSVVITSVYDSRRTLQFNGDRFCFYGSSQASVELYKGTAGYSPSDTNIANTNAVVQKAVLEFAEHFNDTMECVNNGSTANVSTKWTTLSGDFTTALSGFSEDNLTHFKALFANAYSVEGGDTLQDMLARYDYIVAKYKLSDFLKTTGRPEVAQSPHVSPLINIVGEKANSVAIIVIISMVSVTAIGGYFFIRKRKENI